MKYKEELGRCEGCSRALFKGDKYCTFYDDVIMCEEHAVTISDAIAHKEELLEIEETGPFETMQELKDELVSNRREFMRQGNAKLWLKTL